MVDWAKKRINWKVLSTSLGKNVFEQYFYHMGWEAGVKELLAIQESSFIKTGQPSLTQASPREENLLFLGFDLIKWG